MFFTTVEEWIGLGLVIPLVLFIKKKHRDAIKESEKDVIRLFELRMALKGVYMNGEYKQVIAKADTE